MAKNNRYLLRGLQENVWAIDHGKLTDIIDFAEARFNGLAIDIGAIERTPPQAIEAQNGVAVIPILGTLMPRANLLSEMSGGTSTHMVEKAIDEAVEASDVSTIVLEVDSPGGVVAGIEDLRQKIMAACKRKRIIALGRGMVASAAYWVASSAEAFYVTPSTEVGSIGVFMVTKDVSKAADQAGVKFHVFRSGEVKGAGNPYEALSEKAKAELQRRVDSTAEEFVNAVAENRNVSAETVREEFGGGAVFTAKDALAKDMIDDIVTMDQLMGRLQITETESTFTLTAAADGGLPLAGTVSSEPTAAVVEWQSSKEVEMSEEKKTTSQPQSNEVTPDVAPKAVETSKADIVGAAQAAVIAERHRVRDLKARAELLGVEEPLLQKAIDDGEPVESAVEKWLDKMAETQKPVAERIEAVGSEADTVCTGIVNVLGSRMSFKGCECDATTRDMQNMRCADIARLALRAAGKRTTYDDEQDATEFLRLGGSEAQIFAAEASWHQAGDFPNILSNLANKGLETGFDLAEVTYPMWTARVTDLPDLKPKAFMAIATMDEMDKRIADEEAKTLALSEELVGWIQADIYDNKVGLTAPMVANDDLDAFQVGLTGMSYAHENTLNTLCTGILTANGNLPDGNALFDNTNHGNDVTSGAAPSGAQLGAMREKHRVQTGPGGYGFIKTPPKYVLVPAAIETEAIQATVPLLPGSGGQLSGEQVARATDNVINTVRGLITPIVEPELDANSATIYYTIADPRIRRTVIHAFQRGYGRMGRRRTWFTDSRLCRYVALEGRFAAAAISHRGIVRNAGA